MKLAYIGVNGAIVPVFVGQQAGLFAKNGVDLSPVLVSNGSATVASLVSGDTQVAWTDATGAANAAAGGADLLVIGTMLPSYDYLLEATSEIKSVADLKGKKIGVGSLTGGDAVATKLALTKLGMDWHKDVSLVAVGSATTRQAAMIGGAVQAGLELPPESLILETHGFHPVLDMKTLNLPSVNASLVVTGSYARTHHDDVQKFIDGMVQSIAREKVDRATTIQVLKTMYKSTSDADLGKTYDFYAPEAPSLPFPKPELFSAEVQELAVDSPKLLKVDLNKLVDPSFVQSAADRKLDAH
jgi:NitT/TauT family transport system substrate-binding protein